MVLHMTNNVKKLLGVQELPKIQDSDPKGFLVDWNMNLFSIGKKWFFIFTESVSFYSIIDIVNQIDGSEACCHYLLDLVYKAIIKETNREVVLETEVFSIRKTENKAPRCIMVDMIYHAEYCKYKNDLSIFDSINDIPQKLLDWKSSKEVFRERVNKISNKIISV